VFNGTEAEIDGDVLVVEFPVDQEFNMKKIAGDNETIALLRRSIATVLGVDPAVQYRLGRSGGSRKVAAPEPAAQPANSVDDQAAILDHAALEAQVIAELGAEVLDDVTPDE
jgi:hypothetical protein